MAKLPMGVGFIVVISPHQPSLSARLREIRLPLMAEEYTAIPPPRRKLTIAPSMQIRLPALVAGSTVRVPRQPSRGARSVVIRRATQGAGYFIAPLHQPSLIAFLPGIRPPIMVAASIAHPPHRPSANVR